MFVFTYGSLLLPSSLRSTLPQAAWEDCVPARLSGHRRRFQVAFPNDGSQVDKAYFDDRGERPPFVLFADVYRVGGPTAVNGICVPVATEQLTLLGARELRYNTVDVSDRIRPYSGRAGADLDRVLMFLGKPAFTRPNDVQRGVVPESYLDAMENGALFWETHYPGFHIDFVSSTDWPEQQQIVPLTRVNSPGIGSSDLPDGSEL